MVEQKNARLRTDFEEPMGKKEMKPASDWQKEIATQSEKYPNTDVTTQIVRLIQLDALEAALSAVEKLRGEGFFKTASCGAIEDIMREVIPKSEAQKIREFIEEF